MSRWTNSSGDVRSIGARRVRALRTGFSRAWARARGRLPRHVVYLHAQGVVSWHVQGEADAGACFTSFAHWCAAHPGSDADVRISGQAIHSLVIAADLQLHDPAAVRRYALQQFTHYHGPQAAAWPLALWTDGEHCGACGLHGIDLEAMRVEAAAHRVRLVGVAPAWSAGLATLTARDPGFAGAGHRALLLVEGHTATWIVVEHGAIVSLRQRWLDAPRADAVVDLLATLLREAPPLDAPPVVVGWALDAPAPLPPEAGTAFGGLTGPGTMADWMLAGSGRRP